MRKLIIILFLITSGLSYSQDTLIVVGLNDYVYYSKYINDTLSSYIFNLRKHNNYSRTIYTNYYKDTINFDVYSISKTNVWQYVDTIFIDTSATDSAAFYYLTNVVFDDTTLNVTNYNFLSLNATKVKVFVYKRNNDTSGEDFILYLKEVLQNCRPNYGNEYNSAIFSKYREGQMPPD